MWTDNLYAAWKCLTIVYKQVDYQYDPEFDNWSKTWFAKLDIKANWYRNTGQMIRQDEANVGTRPSVLVDYGPIRGSGLPPLLNYASNRKHDQFVTASSGNSTAVPIAVAAGRQMEETLAPNHPSFAQPIRKSFADRMDESKRDFEASRGIPRF